MKILLAIDGSSCSEAAVTEVARLPWPPGSEIRVLKVDEPLDPVLLRGGPATAFDEIIAQRRAESARQLRDAAAVLEQNPSGPRVTQALLEGWPKDAIVTDAESWGADLVVVGSHGHGPFRRLVLGSVSLFVTLQAPCSVLIVREPREGAPAETNPASAEGSCSGPTGTGPVDA